MGRIADLLEKKALGTLTEAEIKELDQLQAEAKLLSEKKDGEPTPPTPPAEPGSDEEEVEKMAQRFADSVSKSVDDKISSLTEKLNKVLDSRELPPVVHGTGKGFIYDAKLGKKIAVEDLTQEKVLLPGRKEKGKTITSVSMRSVYFLQALAQKNVEKLQLLSEGTAADGGYRKLALV